MNNVPMILMFYQANFLLLILQMLGILSNPFVFLLWLLEQLDIYLFGSTSRASDSRIVLSSILNFAMVWASMVVGYTNKERDIGFIMIVLFSYLSSHNFFLALGLKKPFKVINERLLEQRELANIVFS